VLLFSNALTPYETATQWTLEELFGSEKQIHEGNVCSCCVEQGCL